MTMNKRITKIIIGVLATVLAALAFAACSGKKEKKYSVVFDTLGGSDVAAYSLKAGATVKRPSVVPTKDMFTFVDWYTDKTFKTPYTFNTKMPAHNVVIYAGWAGETSVSVTFDANGGKYADGTVAVDYGVVGSVFSAPETEPERVGYIFGGWYTDSACTSAYTFGVYPDSALTLYAGWNKDASYVYVTYIGNESTVAVVPVKKNAELTEARLFDDTVEPVVWYTDAALTSAYTFGGVASTDVVLYTAYGTKGLEFKGNTVVKYIGSAENVVVPSMVKGEKITAVGDYAFNASRVKYITLPNGIDSIGEGAFYGCEYLVEVNLTNKVAGISKNAFYSCARLKRIGDISNVSAIGEAAFLGCKAIRGFELSEKLGSISDYAFYDCAELVDMTIPAGVKTINSYVFGGCSKLSDVQLLATELTSIAGTAFENCKALKSVKLYSSVPPAFPDATAPRYYSPFSSSPEVTVSVPADKLDAYKTAFGKYDNKTLAEKLGVIR